MAENEQDPTALVVFIFYMLGLSGIAARGFFANRAANKANALNTGDTAHFLGQQDFGVVVIFLNMVATFVSGWVVVALPDFGFGLGCVSVEGPSGRLSGLSSFHSKSSF